MEIIFTRQSTTANMPIKMEFDVPGTEYLVKNFTDGDIYVALKEESDKSKCVLIPSECSQIVIAGDESYVSSDGKGIVTIIPEMASEKGVEVQCLKK